MKKFTLTLIVFFVTLGICAVFIYIIEQKKISSLRKTATEIGSTQAQALSRQIERSLSATYALASILRQRAKINNFNSLAEDMINRYGGISNLQLAPGGIVSQIFPLKGNEAAIGHDLLKDPKRSTEALAAIKSRKLTLAGPFELIQGGVAIIGRYPVFLFDEQSRKEKFWGYTIALIKLDKLLHASNFNNLIERDSHYKLSRINPETNQRHFFTESSKEPLYNPVMIKFKVPNGEWFLSISPKNGWLSSLELLSYILISAVGSLLITVLFSQRLNYTAELNATNKMLESEIEERKKSADELIASEEKYKNLSQEFHILLDAIPDSLILLSQDLKVLWSNTAFDFKVGKKTSVCQGKYCYKLCCNISSPCNNCPVIKCFQSGKEEVTQVTDTDGRVLDKRAFPIFDNSGKVSKVIELARDVTAKIRMEEEAELIQSRLIHANKMTSLGALVSGVAHEINNPNSYIMSNAQVFAEIWKDAVEILKENYHDKRDLLIGGLPFPQLLELAPKLLIGINDGSVRIRDIVDNLKSCSQTQRTDMEGKVNVNKVIMSSRSILDHNIKQVTHNFHVNCNENIPHARGNTQQINQVIINLIMNALQSLPDMTSEIWLSTSHNKKSNTVEIKVRDRGVGISDDVLQRVTEPFFTTKADTGGTGLGLSISYAIIKDHQGSMLFKSEKGKGTTVTVSLPVYNRKDLIE